MSETGCPLAGTTQHNAISVYRDISKRYSVQTIVKTLPYLPYSENNSCFPGCCVGCLYLLLSVLQPPVDWKTLRVTTARNYDLSHQLLPGFCCYDNKLFYVEKYCAADLYWCFLWVSNTSDVYRQATPEAHFYHYDFSNCRPRVDESTGHVYLPCTKGVQVFSYEDNKLTTVRETLKCVSPVRSVCVHSPTTLIVCDYSSLYLISVTKDKVIRKFRKPAVGGRPYSLSVLGESLLVCYDEDTLVMHHTEDASPARKLHTQEALKKISGINTDGHSSFLVTSHDYVYVLDHMGNMNYRIPAAVGLHNRLQDCAIVQSELWVAYNGQVKSGFSVFTANDSVQ